MLVSLIFFVIWSVKVRGIYSLCVVAVVVVKVVFFCSAFLSVVLFCFATGGFFTWWILGLRVAPSLWEVVSWVNCYFVIVDTFIV